jgi:hypothetical protein
MIARLEVHAAGADPIAARLRIEAMLGTVEMRPRALPPSTILCVREMRDPLPGWLSLSSRQLHAPAQWKQALEREMDRLGATAAWPARSVVPPTAEAVAFADEAELLVCLGSDLVAGGLATRWWWRLLVRGIEDPARAVGAAWRAAVEHAPAALDQLAHRGEAPDFVAALEGGDVRALIAAIAERFALPLLSAIGEMSDARSARQGRQRPVEATPPAACVPPWNSIAAEASEPPLPPQRNALLGIVLTLARAPAVVRSDAFAARVIAWLRAVEPTPTFVQPRSAAAASRQSTIPPTSPATNEGDFDVVGPESLPPTASQTQRLGTGPTPAPSRDELCEPTSAEQPVSGLDAESSNGQVEARAIDSPRFSAARERKLVSARPRTRVFGPAIETELGGLFYLINLAQYLNLYSDDENLSLSPWDFIELIGRQLLGGFGSDDPVWLLLAALSGRADGEPAGSGFEPSPDWRMPALWLNPFAQSAVGWSVHDGRLLVTHEDGFVLLDLPAVASLADELLPYGRLTPVPSSPPSLPDAPLERWLARLIPYLRARLRLALALDVMDDLPTVLLRHHARVHASETHLDIVLSLETLPVGIRLAGLDRDPGWVAAAGRFIAFHFE